MVTDNLFIYAAANSEATERLKELEVRLSTLMRVNTFLHVHAHSLSCASFGIHTVVPNVRVQRTLCVTSDVPSYTLSSLIPRLPPSGTRTLKLCRRGEPGIFCHVKSAKGRKEVERT